MGLNRAFTVYEFFLSHIIVILIIHIIGCILIPIQACALQEDLDAKTEMIKQLKDSTEGKIEK